MTNEITPIILAGGVGSRLWPLSRKSYPKQFINIIGDNTLFQQAAARLTSSKKVKFKPHITVTNSDYRFIICDQFLKIGVNPGPIIIEPELKNTAPAILSAVLLAQKNNSEICIVSPSDHIIPNTNEFHEAVNIAIDGVKKGKIITFGIKPKNPETGYGYLELEKNKKSKIINLIRFIEKPNEVEAKKMISNDNYLWNSGIFMFTAKDLILAFQKYAPDIFLNVQNALDQSKEDLAFIRLDPQSWSKCTNISLDYAIMEKADNLCVVPFNESWSDLGDWSKIWQEMKPDKNGNSLSSQAHAINCSNSLLRSETKLQEIIGVGLKNIIAIALPDAVLVAHKKKTQEIKNIVEYLKLKDIPQSELSPKEHRPWGWFEILTIGYAFKVKKLCVNQGQSVSLQSHQHRSEHWIVVEGTAKITIEENVTFLNVGNSIYVPKLAVHRIENTTNKPVILIEVQIGKYLGEDDITRYEDIYSRN